MKETNDFSPRRHVELFHLLFLAQLGQKLDKRHYALKGGCNLRFFHKSIRYSEDIDLDLQDIPAEKTAAVADAILSSRSFADILRAYGLAIARWSKPKQTETTQRWKVALAVTDSDMILPTKVEFSRRGMVMETRFAAVDPLIIQSYHLSPLLVSHYAAQEAFEQKIAALADRRETQARDVFDASHLLNSGADPARFPPILRERLPRAIENALSVTFPVFKSQVLSFLHPDQRQPYDSAEVWQDLVLGLVGRIEGETR
ncbi:MAG: nucleotidyl transferase AbiEii/AbiGii toxin family protein [Acidobacteria bacterium]|jgi:predicted nucleotidyltransferase component of viral defense system|nr:nucleotidyl transferase AbiEii/AbiGii toxin family protein [Acidobacteriota bacterium]